MYPCYHIYHTWILWDPKGSIQLHGQNMCKLTLKSQTAGRAAGGPNFLFGPSPFGIPLNSPLIPFMPLKFNIIQHFNPMKFHKIPMKLRYIIPSNPRASPSLGAWDAEVHLLYGCYRSGVHGGLPSSQRGTCEAQKSGGRVGDL